MLPSDPGYIPAAPDQQMRELPIYQELLALNTDPYAAHSRDEGLIQILEEFLR